MNNRKRPQDHFKQRFLKTGKQVSFPQKLQTLANEEAGDMTLTSDNPINIGLF